MTRLGGIVIGLLALVLALPAGASAATFYVDGTGSANPCTSPPPAPGCGTIMDAVDQARGGGFPGGDVIRVAAGTYPESSTFGVYLNNAADAGDVIVGAGSGAAGTVIRPNNATAFGLGTGGGGPTPLTVKNLRVNLADAPDAADAMDINTPHAVVKGVNVLEPNAANGAIAISVDGGAVTLSRFNLSGSWTGQGVAMENSASVTAVKSHIQGGNGDTNAVLVVGGASFRAKGSVLSKADGGGDALEIQNGDATLDSSILVGSGTAVDALNTGAPVAVTLRQVTIDPGDPGASGSAGAAIYTNDIGGSGTTTVTLDNSIALALMYVYQGATTTATVTCTHSELSAFQVQAPNPGPPSVGAIQCPDGFGNSSHATQNKLFVDAPGGNLHLRKGSPMIDDGSKAPLAPGEYPRDIDGNKRIIDGDGNGTARRDKGADEFKP